MTWYAHHVFAEPSPEVILAMRNLPGIGDALFRIDHLQEYEWEEQEVDWVETTPEGPIEHHRTVKRGPKVPEEGLLVARELCEAGSLPARWFGDAVVPWEDVAVMGPEYLGPLANLDRLSHGSPSRLEGTPPPGLLGAIRSVARATKSIVSYFARSTWGGDTMYSYAWVWDGKRNRDFFYRASHRDDVNGVMAIDPDWMQFIIGGDVLTLVLIHHGLMLPDRSFLPHTRAFPWEQYRLPRDDL